MLRAEKSAKDSFSPSGIVIQITRLERTPVRPPFKCSRCDIDDDDNALMHLLGHIDLTSGPESTELRRLSSLRGFPPAQYKFIGFLI